MPESKSRPIPIPIPRPIPRPGRKPILTGSFISLKLEIEALEGSQNQWVKHGDLDTPKSGVFVRSDQVLKPDFAKPMPKPPPTPTPTSRPNPIPMPNPLPIPIPIPIPISKSIPIPLPIPIPTSSPRSIPIPTSKSRAKGFFVLLDLDVEALEGSQNQWVKLG